MKAPNPRWLVPLSLIAVLGASAGTGAAVAADLIGSADIADNSLRSVDVRDETLVGADVRNGSLNAEDFSGPLPAEVFTWTATYTTDGSVIGYDAPPLLTSDDALPARTHVQVVDFDVQGDFSSCISASVDVGPKPVGGWWRTRWPFVARFNYDQQTPQGSREVNDVQLRPDGATRLIVRALCNGFPNATPTIVPTFTITLTFATTPVAGTDGALFE
jgi:hypothetical protein